MSAPSHAGVRSSMRNSWRRAMVAVLVDADDAEAAVVASAQTCDRAVTRMEIRNPVETQRVRERDVDGKSVREDDDAHATIRLRRRRLQRGEDAGAKLSRLRAEIANRIGDEPGPRLAALRAQCSFGSMPHRRGIGLAPAVDRVDRQAEPLRQRDGGLLGASQRAGAEAGEAFV